MRPQKKSTRNRKRWSKIFTICIYGTGDFNVIFDYIEQREESMQRIFFDGQIYDAFSLLVELISKAEQEIVLIDNYVDVEEFNQQYPTLEVKYTGVFHDRFLIIDEKLAYHVGASIKDAGKKCFGINKIEDERIIKDILERLKLESE